VVAAVLGAPFVGIVGCLISAVTTPRSRVAGPESVTAAVAPTTASAGPRRWIVAFRSFASDLSARGTTDGDWLFRDFR
jgi:hypothetical protein